MLRWMLLGITRYRRPFVMGAAVGGHPPALYGSVLGPGVWVVIFLLALVAPAALSAAEHAGTPDNYRAWLPRLVPGDVLHLAAGVYRRGLPLRGLHGTPDAPITIRGPAEGEPAVFVGRPGHNTVSLANVSHLIIRDLVIRDGGHFVGAVKAEGFRQCESVHHITLEGLDIRGHGRSQQQVGISTKCPAWGWVIRNNRIEGAGTGIYLGDSDGNAPFFSGVIEGNRVEATVGYNLQIKHQLVRPEVPSVPGGALRTIIRHNIFSKARASGRDAMARPNVLVGHPPLSGVGRDDEYLIYGNVFYANPHEALFQGEGNISLYNNVFVNPQESGFPAIAIQPHNWVPKRIRVLFNTVVAPSGGIRVTAGGLLARVRVEGNAVFSSQPFNSSFGDGNLARDFDAAAEELKAPFAGPSDLDPCPRPGRLLGAPSLDGDSAKLPGMGRDYRRMPRSRTHYGACEP